MTAGLALAQRDIGCVAVNDWCQLLSKIHAMERLLIDDLFALVAVPAEAIFFFCSAREREREKKKDEEEGRG